MSFMLAYSVKRVLDVYVVYIRFFQLFMISDVPQISRNVANIDVVRKKMSSSVLSFDAVQLL